jgi:hypothetical protein
MWWGQTWKGVRCSLGEDVSLRPSVSCVGLGMAGPFVCRVQFWHCHGGSGCGTRKGFVTGLGAFAYRRVWGCGGAGVTGRGANRGRGGMTQTDIDSFAHRQTQTDWQIFLFMYFSTFSFTHSDCLIFIINKLRLPNRMTFLFSFLWGVLSFLFGRKETT